MIDYECNDCPHYPNCSLERITENSRHNSEPCSIKEWLKLRKQNATNALMQRTANGV